jgi:hypothetical protein
MAMSGGPGIALGPDGVKLGGLSVSWRYSGFTGCETKTRASAIVAPVA